MPARLPDVSGLLALLDRFRTPKRSGLPGGSATEEEIAFAEKDSPIKGEHRRNSHCLPTIMSSLGRVSFMIERYCENQRNYPRAASQIGCFAQRYVIPFESRIPSFIATSSFSLLLLLQTQ
ncbi:hypothetical protein DER44DRAFT_819570 [Fusarium oxysporum]|nr:hypothetical protein DER44DRAFT_819570 [Fusarium oxysporum]